MTSCNNKRNFKFKMPIEPINNMLPQSSIRREVKVMIMLKQLENPILDRHIKESKHNTTRNKRIRPICCIETFREWQLLKSPLQNTQASGQWIEQKNENQNNKQRLMTLGRWLTRLLSTQSILLLKDQLDRATTRTDRSWRISEWQEGLTWL